VTLNISRDDYRPLRQPLEKAAGLDRRREKQAQPLCVLLRRQFSSSHLPLEIFSRALGLKFRHVPSTGGGRASAPLSQACRFAPSTLVDDSADQGQEIEGPGDPERQAPGFASRRAHGQGTRDSAEFYQNNAIAVPKNTPCPSFRNSGRGPKVVGDKGYTDVVEKLGDEVYFLIGDEMVERWKSEGESINKVMEAMVKEQPQKK